MSSNPYSPTVDAATATQIIDLSQLAVTRTAAPTAAPHKLRRRWITRYVIPGAILLGFGGLFAWAARDSFLPAQAVTVMPVLVSRAKVQQAGTPLFQAAGWIEPRPTAVVVSALAPGVVEKLFVVEGQQVAAGEPVAQLIDVDAILSLQQAEAHLRLCEADVSNADAMAKAAQVALENPNELQAALADAESRLAELQLSLSNLPYLIQAASARRALAVDNLTRKRQAGDAVAGRVVREAEAEHSAADSALAELQARGPTLAQQGEALSRKQAALAQQLELMTNQKQAVASTTAALAAAHARREQAQLAVQAARLTLDRMTIRAPMAGRVLTLDARPGTRLAGMDPASQQSSSDVISLYDPEQLQVRVDVRLEDVPQVAIGQPVSIETAALAAPLAGQVSWVTTRADIQKNTLQVKVAINNPPATITPEMLAQVTFVAPPQPESAAVADDPLRMLVPRALVVQGESGGASLWVIHPHRNVAELRPVEIGKATAGDLIEIAAGVDPTAKLIVAGRESLAAGDRVRITGEAPSAIQGVGGPPTAAPASVAQAPSHTN